MMVSCKHICIFFLAFQMLWVSHTQAQEIAMVDSLLNELATCSSDTQKIDLLLDLSIACQDTNKELSLSYGNQGLALAEKIGYKRAVGQCINTLGTIYLIHKDHILATENFERAKKIFLEIGYKRGIADAWLNLGNAAMWQGHYDKAVENFRQAIKVAEGINYQEGLSKCYRNLGIVEAYQSNYTQSINYFEQSLSIERALGDKGGVSDCLNNISVIYNYQGNHLKSIEYLEQALVVSEEMGNKKSIGRLLINLGVSYDDQSMYDEALECYEKALVIKMELDEKVGISICYNNMGEVYTDRGDYAKAIEYYEKSLLIDQELESQADIAICLLNIGKVHFLKEDYPRAKDYYREAMEMAEKLDEKRIVANILNSLGELNIRQLDYDNAHINLKKAFKISTKLGDESEIAQSVYLSGQVFMAQKQFNRAVEKFNQAMELHGALGEYGKVGIDNVQIAQANFELENMDRALEYAHRGFRIGQEIQSKEIIRNASELLSKIYAHQKKYAKAYEYMVLFKTVHDSIFTLESIKQINRVEHRFELERKQNEIEIQKIRLEKQSAEIKQQELQQKALLGGMFTGAFIIVLVVMGYLRIQKANTLVNQQKDQIEESNEELNQANEELQVTVETVNNQKQQIEKKSKEITDSIYYAQYIQRAILPKVEDLEKLLRDYFILYQPKDIVSGDFYWITEVEGRVLVATVDCTGHGVPGAFMSMLGGSFLNDIINKEYITHTGVILRRLRKEVINALQQKGAIGEQRDGMDISLCSIDFKKMELQFSGANNPLYIIRPSAGEPVSGARIMEAENFTLYEIKGDTMPIALYEKMGRYKDTEFKIFKGDLLYMFSDGYIDQFGGTEGKRLKSKPFKELLLANCHKPLAEQKQILEVSLNTWKQDHQQIDDIMVLAFRV